MNRFSLFTRQALALVLIFLLSACAEEPLDGNDPAGEGHTVTLRLAASVAPIPETKATVTPARSGSEAEAAGFYYEMVSSDAETGTGTPGLGIEVMPAEEDSCEINFSPKALVSKALSTRAPSVLKNTYALLFTSTGAFNGRAPIGTYTVGSPQDITFTNVANTKADGCRLVIVANDDLAATSYASSKGTGNFADFTGTYADFQKLTLTSTVNQDTDVPYAGSATVNLSQSETGETVEAPLFWTLAKVTLDNKLFQIEGGPARSSIILYNGGERRFATPAADDYEGTGNTQTTAFLPAIDSGNKDITTWYVGENIRPAGTGISSAADRNSWKAPVNACYIEIKSTSAAVPENTNPAIGEEYVPRGGGKAFTYVIYLGKSADVSDFSLRRHTYYGLTAEVDGTLDSQKQLATEDGRVTFSGGAGLAIGRFGGPVGYTGGAFPKVTGSYESMLLLEPNTSRTTAKDNVTKRWGEEGIESPMETHRYFDWKYIYGVKIENTVGGMTTAADGLYAYCNKLTLGGVPEGTWYVPPPAQHYAIHAVLDGLKEKSFSNYTAFADGGTYWTCAVYDKNQAWYAIYHFIEPGAVWYEGSKTLSRYVRCVRDASITKSAGPQVTEIGGYPVIDLSGLSPLGCVLTPAEAAARCEEINSQTPSNTAFLPVGIEVSGEKGTWNAKMSPRFQLMRADLLTGTDWATAYKGCKQYGGEGGKPGQWRLPTQRELKMIWLLHPQLSGKGGITPFTYITDVFYFACNEHAPERAWYTIFGYPCTTPNIDKSSLRQYTRCVRDLE